MGDAVSAPVAFPIEFFQEDSLPFPADRENELEKQVQRGCLEERDIDEGVSPIGVSPYHLSKCTHAASDDVIRMNLRDDLEEATADVDGDAVRERDGEEGGGRGRGLVNGKRRKVHARSHQGVLRRRNINVAPNARIQSIQTPSTRSGHTLSIRTQVQARTQTHSLPRPPSLSLSQFHSQSRAPADDERRKVREARDLPNSPSIPPLLPSLTSVLHSSDVRSLTPEPENPPVGSFHLFPPHADVSSIVRSLTPEIGTQAPARAKHHRMMSDRRRHLTSYSPMKGLSLSSASSFIPSAASSALIPPSHYVSERGAPSTEEEEEEEEGRERKRSEEERGRERGRDRERGREKKY